MHMQKKQEKAQNSSSDRNGKNQEFRINIAEQGQKGEKRRFLRHINNLLWFLFLFIYLKSCFLLSIFTFIIRGIVPSLSTCA